MKHEATCEPTPRTLEPPTQHRNDTRSGVGRDPALEITKRGAINTLLSATRALGVNDTDMWLATRFPGSRPTDITTALVRPARLSSSRIGLTMAGVRR